MEVVLERGTNKNRYVQDLTDLEPEWIEAYSYYGGGAGMREHHLHIQDLATLEAGWLEEGDGSDW